MTLITVLSLAIAVGAIVIAMLRRGGSADVEDARVPALEQALAAEKSARSQREADHQQASRAATQEIRDVSVRAASAEANVESYAQTIAGLRMELAESRSAQTGLATEQQRLNSALASARMALDKEQEKAAEKLTVLLEAKKELSDQFSTLANKILEEKSERFAEQNKASLDQMLLPLKAQLSDFKGTVERVYVEEGEKRSALAEQVRQLAMLNSQLSTDAIGLTNALKGSSKTQGIWGEMVLESILEAGGLRKGLEYHVQEAHKQEDGRTVFPDVILHLPEGRHLVIDAKVSLIHYNDHVNGTSDEHREQAAKRHVVSMQTHFRGLSEKDYRSLDTLNTVDFVIMFVPIEPAFMLGISRDPNLWTQAWEKNVLLVSPSTLLFVVRTVSHIWKQEQQRDNVKEIARQGGDLYDKFAAFVADLNAVGEQLKRTQKAYDLATNKLSTGKGNLVNRAEKLRRMGIKVSKRLPDGLVRAAAESSGEDPDDSELEDDSDLALPSGGQASFSQAGLLDLSASEDAADPAESVAEKKGGSIKVNPGRWPS